MGNQETCVMSVDGELAVAECSLARKKAECEILIAERKALMAQLESASDTSGMEGDWAKEKAALQARIKELEAMIKKLESRLQDMESQLAQCKRDAANNAAGKDEAARLAALLAKCEGRNKQLEQELSRTAGQLQAAENTTNMIRMELGGLQIRLCTAWFGCLGCRNSGVLRAGRLRLMKRLANQFKRLPRRPIQILLLCDPSKTLTYR